MLRSCLGTAIAASLLLSMSSPENARAATPTVLQWQTPNLVEQQFKPIWQEMIAAFEAANPDIKVEPILVARKDSWTRFVTAAQARRAPCVVEVDVIPAADDGYLLPLDSFWNAEPAAFRDAWSKDVLDGGRWHGKLYGIPLWGGVYGEVYNKKMVEAAGLDPTRLPTTWTDYLTWMDALTKPGQQWGTAIVAGDTDTTTRSLLSWIWSNGGKAFNDNLTKATFASDPRSLAAIHFYIDLAVKGLAAPGPTTTNYLQQTDLFSQQKIAAMRTAYWAVAKVAGDNPSLKGQMLVGPPPATIPDPPVLFTETQTSISSSCRTPEAAWKFIRFEAGRKWAVMRATVADWLPLRRDVADAPEIQADPLMAAFLKMAMHARPYPLPTPVWAEIASIDIVKAVQEAILHPDRIDAIFKKLDVDVTAKLQNAG